MKDQIPFDGISFDDTTRVLERYVKDLGQIVDDDLTFYMDLMCVKLDVDRLLAAPPADFLHDVVGIRNHINRQTGLLEDFFVPRCAA